MSFLKDNKDEIARVVKEKVEQEDLADGITQLVYIDLNKKIDEKRSKGEKWKFTNLIINQTISNFFNKEKSLEKRQKKYGKEKSPDNYKPSRFLSPEQYAEREKIKKRVWEAVDKLPDKQRKVITLHLRGTYTNKKIAEELKISVSNVSTTKRRAKDNLKTLLKEYA